MRKSIALGVLTVLLAATNAFAGAEARISGKVVDAATKQPIAGALISIEATEAKTVKKETKTDKSGAYALFILDGTVRYKFTYTAPGYNGYEEVIKLKLGEPNQKDVELPKAGPAAGAARGPAAPDPSAVAYNEGALLANAGKSAEAVEKFEAAVKAKPTFTPGWIALAKTHQKLKNYDKAIEAARKALDIDDEDTEMWGVLVKSYTALGDKAKAAEAQKHMPANATELFNQAAALINKGNDSDAEPLLKKAIASDEAMSLAYYELGMIYVRGGNTADAKTNLQKYLDLDPNGKESATAKEMLKYIQ